MLEKGYQWVYLTFYVDLFIVFMVSAFKRTYPATLNDHGLIKEYRYSKVLGLLFCVPITIISACRTAFIDTGDYVLMFNYTAPDFSTINDGVVGDVETGFIYFLAILKRITLDPQILFIVTSVWIYFAFVKFMYENCIDVPFALLIFLCRMWTDSMNGLRQYIVASVVCLVWTKWARSNKSLKNDLIMVLIIILCTQFHKSVLICAIIFLITRGKFFNIGTKISMLGTVALFTIPGLYNFLFDNLLASDNYSDYKDANAGMGIMRLLVNLVPVIFIIINRNKNKYDTENPDDITNWMMNISLFSVCCSVMAMKMVYFARLNIYFDIFNVVLIPNLIEKNIDGKIKLIIKPVAFCLYSIFFFYQMKAYGSYMSNQFDLSFLH